MQVLRNCISSFRFTGSGLLNFASHQQTPVFATQSQQFSLLAPAKESLGGQARSLLQPSHDVIVTSVRTKIRNFFPKPSEVKRIRRHSLAHRLKTPAGRLIIIRRIIKGRHVLAH